MNNFLTDLFAKKINFIRSTEDLIILSNYQNIIEYLDEVIIIDDIQITGNNLKISKMEENKIEITGKVKEIKIK